MARIKGVDRHKQRLRAMREQTPREVARRLYIVGQEIEIDAEVSITRGSISGPNHVPSRPGEPPNADTRRLDTSTETVLVSQNPPEVHVISNAPYSAALEYGTSKMLERPFMRPAAQRKRRRAVEVVGEAVSFTVRKG